ncbi:hypothetical protein EDD17DRAFT_1439238, partial [Pisolithus thermaeus]
EILSLLDSWLSGNETPSQTGVSITTISILCSRHCPYLIKSPGGHPKKLSDGNIQHACCCVGSAKAENAGQVTRELRDII